MSKKLYYPANECLPVNHKTKPLTPAEIMAGMWVPVTERLPEKEKKSYLCRTDDGYHCEVRWTDNKYGLWSGGGEWGWSIFDIPQYSKVTHWMPLPPLPQPPKEAQP